MSLLRRFVSAVAIAAMCLSPIAAAADDSGEHKDGFWTVGRGDAESDRCFASVPTKSGETFLLVAMEGQVSFSVGARKPVRQGKKGVFLTDAWQFQFEPGFSEKGDIVYFDDFLSERALAALRLARGVGVIVDGRTILDANLENTGFEDALDAVIDCSNGKSGWWGQGLVSGGGGAKAAQAGGTGTGFFISADGIAVTAAHVVQNCSRVESPRWGAVRVLASDLAADLAILKTPSGSGQFLSLRGRGPKLGEAATAAGYPFGQMIGGGLKITTGVVSGLAGPGGDRSLFQLSAPIQPGNSGGPVIDGGGALIGVTSSKLDEIKVASATGTLPQNINFAVPVTVLQSFLEENGVNYRTAAAGTASPTSGMPSYTFNLICHP